MCTGACSKAANEYIYHALTAYTLTDLLTEMTKEVASGWEPWGTPFSIPNYGVERASGLYGEYYCYSLSTHHPQLIAQVLRRKK